MKKPENLINHWWWIVLCAILFAGLGNLIVVFLPRQYSASVDLQILFEPNQEINWTDKYMLYFTEQIGRLVEAPAIQTAIINDLSAQGVPLSETAFAQYASKERRFYGWKLTVTTDDPALTQTILNSWQTIVMTAIQQDRSLGLEAQEQRALAATWLPCLQQLPVEPFHPVCNPTNAMEIATFYTQAHQQYLNTLKEIQYLTDYPPHYSIQLMGRQPVSTISRIPQPAVILGCLLIGILIGTLTIEYPWTSYLQLKRGAS